MTAIKDSQAIRSILDYMEDSQPRALVALAQSGQIRTYLTSLADRVQNLTAKLAKEPHPMFKDRELGMEEAEMEALQQILTSEEEETETTDLEAASKVAKQIRKMLESES